jgi:hypothetical protein
LKNVEHLKRAELTSIRADKKPSDDRTRTSALKEEVSMFSAKVDLHKSVTKAFSVRKYKFRQDLNIFRHFRASNGFEIYFLV